MEKAEKERKYKLSFRFVPTQCVIENSKQMEKKNSENLKIPNKWSKLRKQENKNYHSVSFQPDA